jgi:hypothetical protein
MDLSSADFLPINPHVTVAGASPSAGRSAAFRTSVFTFADRNRTVALGLVTIHSHGIAFDVLLALISGRYIRHNAADSEIYAPGVPANLGIHGSQGSNRC